MGEIAYTTGDYALAGACYEESLSIILRLDDRWVLAIYLDGLAKVSVAQGDAIYAVQLLSAAEALRQTIGASITTPLESAAREQMRATLHSLLEEPVFAAAWAKGQAMSPERAVATRHPVTQTASPSPPENPIMSVRSPRSLHDDLTQRERDVLRLVALGLTDAQVAERLVISRRTVNFHLTSIYRKLQVSSRSAATRYALECHLF